MMPFFQAERARASTAERPDDRLPGDQQTAREHQAGGLQQHQQGGGGGEQEQTDAALLRLHCCSVPKVST